MEDSKVFWIPAPIGVEFGNIQIQRYGFITLRSKVFFVNAYVLLKSSIPKIVDACTLVIQGSE